MSTLTLDDNPSTYQIRAYTPGKIQINETIYTHSLILSPHQLLEPWPVNSIEQLSISSLSPIHAMNPEIIIIGTGTLLIFPSPEIYLSFIQQGIGVEIMDTQAACRTFSALTAENRKVVAALII